MTSSSSCSSSVTATASQASHRRASASRCRRAWPAPRADQVGQQGGEHRDQAGRGRDQAQHRDQAGDRDPDADHAAEEHHPAVQRDAPGDHGAQAEQRGQIEDVRADDDPGADLALVGGERGDGGGDLRCVRRQRGDHAEQGLRQAQPFADPFQPGDQDVAGGEADGGAGHEQRGGESDWHRGVPPGCLPCGPGRRRGRPGPSSPSTIDSLPGGSARNVAWGSGTTAREVGHGIARLLAACAGGSGLDRGDRAGRPADTAGDLLARVNQLSHARCALAACGRGDGIAALLPNGVARARGVPGRAPGRLVLHPDQLALHRRRRSPTSCATARRRRSSWHERFADAGAVQAADEAGLPASGAVQLRRGARLPAGAANCARASRRPMPGRTARRAPRCTTRRVPPAGRRACGGR